MFHFPLTGSQQENKSYLRCWKTAEKKSLVGNKSWMLYDMKPQECMTIISVRLPKAKYDKTQCLPLCRRIYTVFTLTCPNMIWKKAKKEKRERKKSVVFVKVSVFWDTSHWKHLLSINEQLSYIIGGICAHKHRGDTTSRQLRVNTCM